MEAASISSRLPALTSIQCSDVSFSHDHSQVSFTLSWLTYDGNDCDPIQHVDIFSSLVVSETRVTVDGARVKDDKPRKPPLTTTYKFWGRSFSNCYRVAHFHLLQSDRKSSSSDSGGGSGQVIKYAFRLQPVTVSRSKPSLRDCPRVIVTL